MESRNDVLKKLQGVISKTPSQWNQDVLLRSENKPWKKRSQAVALKVLRTLRAKGISQKDLAEQIGVSAQQVNKWVKGNENFTFETISKLETALGVELMSIKGYQSQKQHIQSKLEAIIKKAQENMKDVWSEDLETVSTAAVTSDLDDIEYNGWFDDLVALKDELK